MKRLLTALLAATLLSACASPHGSDLPNAPANVMPAVTTATITESGIVTGLLSNGFGMYAGSHCGNIHVYTTSSTVFSGPAVAKNSQVTVVGTGSCATSITATSVTVKSSTNPSPTPSAAPTASPLARTMRWQIGETWHIATDGQCGSPTFPTATSANFVLNRYSGCMRNQLNPIGNGGSGVYLLNVGQSYTWKFQTVTHMGTDSDQYTQRLVWQIHQYACGISPNTVLGIQHFPSQNQVWYWQAGGKTFTMPYTEGATDTWQITAKIDNSSAGTEKLIRNGVVVASTTGSNFICGGDPFWNFGPYMWNWVNQGGGVSDLTQVSILFNYMQLMQP